MLFCCTGCYLCTRCFGTEFLQDVLDLSFEIYCKSCKQNPHGWWQFEIKGNNGRSFCPGWRHRNNTPAKFCQPPGRWLKQFSIFSEDQEKSFRKQIVCFVIIVRGVHGAVFVNDLLEMWSFKLADHSAPDWLFQSTINTSQSSAMMLISFSSSQWQLLISN